MDEKESKIKNGKLNVMGVDVNISQTLGEMICNQYLSSISEEDMEKIINAVDRELFDKDARTGVKKLRGNNSNFYYETQLMDKVKSEFGKAFKEELTSLLIERMQKPEFKSRMESFADEIIEYAVTGFKEDIAAHIRNRLVSNLFNNDPVVSSGGESLYQIINAVIDNRFRQ